MIQKIKQNLIKEIILKSHPENIDFLKKEASYIVDKYIEDCSKSFDYYLCLDEIFSNAVVHAYKKNFGNLNVKFYEKKDCLVTQIEDFGSGMPRTKIRSILKKTKIEEDDLFKQSGRGLFIVKSLSNKLEIKKLKRGTCIRFYFEKRK